LIEVDKLTRYFGDITAIDNVTFRVEQGEVLGFLGPNAAGKTTTMRILTGFLPASKGTARVASFDVFQNPLEVKKRIGYLPENPPLYAEMTVYSFLDFIAKIKGIDPRDRKQKISNAIDKAGLGDRISTIVKHLSKGYKQRLGIAQAIIHEPEVLILDEPTIGLDPKQIIEVRELIKNLAGKHTVILSTQIKLILKQNDSILSDLVIGKTVEEKIYLKNNLTDKIYFVKNQVTNNLSIKTEEFIEKLR
jgi:ABC-2 type transport system ATP-binding protein